MVKNVGQHRIDPKICFSVNFNAVDILTLPFSLFL
jgi:hypothetical protein